jgi:hypothetical protein
VNVPAEYEVTGITGASLRISEYRKYGGIEGERGRPPASFLISMELDSKSGAPFLVQECSAGTGEVLIEGNGTMELTATEVAV